jgi:Zn-finger nucleic acid-binding protein
MKCPVCDVTLSISAREGVEIDFCPQCRGVWLDRGELDKILDRVTAGAPAAPAPAPSAPPAPSYDDRRPEPRYDDRRPEPRYDDRHRHDDRPRYDDRDRYDSRKKKKRGSFLEDIFDF